MKKISIITITFNNLEGLRKTVNSVVTQTSYNNIEYVIIDGNSTDGTKQYLHTLSESICWISESDKGISNAFNKGLERVSGDYIFCLNSGDTFVNSNVISKVIEQLEKSNVDILSYKVRVNSKTCIPQIEDERVIFETCDMPHQGTFVSRKIYDIVGGYSEEYHIRMDYHFFARCKKENASFKYISQVIVNYEPGGVSMKPENRIKFWKEGMSIKYMYGLQVTIKDMIKTILWLRK